MIDGGLMEVLVIARYVLLHTTFCVAKMKIILMMCLNYENLFLNSRQQGVTDMVGLACQRIEQ